MIYNKQIFNNNKIIFIYISFGLTMVFATSVNKFLIGKLNPIVPCVPVVTIILSQRYFKDKSCYFSKIIVINYIYNLKFSPNMYLTILIFFKFSFTHFFFFFW